MRSGNKKLSVVAALFALLTVSGCATAPQRNYSGDIDSLNSRVSSLQNELSDKDAEIARLQSQANSQDSALKQAEEERRLLNEKLAEASKKETPKPVVKAYDSDLK